MSREIYCNALDDQFKLGDKVKVEGNNCEVELTLVEYLGETWEHEYRDWIGIDDQGVRYKISRDLVSFGNIGWFFF